jgi:TRAP-type C4-dicarboxylate transport system substrate-binding protein
MKKSIAVLLALALVLMMAAGCAQGTATPTDNASNTPSTQAPDTQTPDTQEPSDEPSGEPTYQWRLGTQEAQGHPLADSAYRFAETLNKATNGDIEITVYPSGQLGDYEQMFEEVTIGTLEMAWISGPASFDQMMDIQGIPYLVENWDQANQLWCDREGYIYTKFDEIMDNLNATMLGIVPGGFLGVGANNLGDLNTLWDPNASQGVLIRNPSMDVARMIVEALGFNSVTIAYSDLYSSLQTGVADGWYGGGAALNYQNFRDVIKYYADFRYLFEIMEMLINKDLLASLPQEYQDLIWELAIEEQATAFAEFEAWEKEGYDALTDYGIKVLYPTDEQMGAVATHVRDVVYPQLDDLFGADVMNAIKEQVAALQ